MPSLAGTARGQVIVRDNLFLPIIFFISPLATSVASRLTPFFVAIVGFSLIAAALRRGLPWRELLPPRAALAACLLFAAYVFLNAFWSVDPLAGIGKAALLLSLVVITFAAVEAASSLKSEVLHQSAIAFAAGALLGALFVLIELLTGGILTRTLLGWFPHLVSPKYLKRSHGIIVSLNLSKLDQNVNLAMFNLWPGLLALMGLARTRRMISMILFFAAISTVITFSKHDSSQVALVASSLVVLLALKWRTLVIRSLAVLWCAAFVFVIPLSFAAYDNGLHFAHWLPDSARARVIIWEYTAEQTLKRPLLGVGVDSTPTLSVEQRRALIHDKPEGFIYPRTTGHHAHNIFLQTWYELGAVGALLLAAAGAAVVLLIFLLPVATQPFAAGAFVSFAVVGAFAWGMWQSWFLCAVALLVIYLRVVGGVLEREGTTIR
jgi:O-Antigen ligase